MANYLTITYIDSSGQQQTVNPSTTNPFTGKRSPDTLVNWYYYLLTDVYTTYSITFNTTPGTATTFYTVLTGAPGPGANGGYPAISGESIGYGGGGGAGEATVQTYSITNNPDPFVPGAEPVSTVMTVYLVPEAGSQDCYISLQNNFFNFSLLSSTNPYQNFANQGTYGTSGAGGVGNYGGNGGNGGSGTNTVMFYSPPNLPAQNYNSSQYQNGYWGGGGGNAGSGYQPGNPGAPGNSDNTSGSSVQLNTDHLAGSSYFEFQDGQSSYICRGGVAGINNTLSGSSGAMPFFFIYYYVDIYTA